MIDSAHARHHIDRHHSAAIRREIGDRLRISLNAERVPLSPHLATLLEQLAVTDRAEGRHASLELR